MRPSRELEEKVESLTAGKQSLEKEVERGKQAVDTIRSEVESKQRGLVESLTNKCQEYEQKLGKSSHRICDPLS